MDEIDADDTAYINEHANLEASKIPPQSWKNPPSLSSLDLQVFTHRISQKAFVTLSPIIIVQWKITLSKRIPNIGDTAIFHWTPEN